MIDDYDATMDLIRKMELILPIPARPTGALVKLMKTKGVKLARDQEMPIKQVFYMGDEGGISCDVTPVGMTDPLICSITQIRVKPKHPLAKEIRAYQKERTRSLAQVGRVGGFAQKSPKKRK